MANLPESSLYIHSVVAFPSLFSSVLRYCRRDCLVVSPNNACFLILFSHPLQVACIEVVPSQAVMPSCFRETFDVATSDRQLQRSCFKAAALEKLQSSASDRQLQSFRAAASERQLHSSCFTAASEMLLLQRGWCVAERVLEHC